jgi:hypothetical protein
MTSVGIIMKKYFEVMFRPIFEVLGTLLIVCFLLVTCLGYSFTLQMEAVSSSDTSVISIVLDYVKLQRAALLIVKNLRGL